MPQKAPLAFVDVNIVPMDSERIIPHQTVIIDNGRIVKIDHSSKIIPPKNMVQIVGSGLYLMPGLADMHTHTWAIADFLLFLANGVTTIRNMWGGRRHLLWRKRIARGELLGPTIFTAGPIIDGNPPIWNTSKPVVTAQEAREEVSQEKKLGYDFVKVYNRLSIDAYEAIIESARKFGMPVAGHVPTAVGLETALKSGQTIEHLTGYIDALEADDSPMRGKLDRPSRRVAVNFLDEAKLSGIVEATIAANVWNCVTLIVTRKFVPLKQAQELLRDPIMRFVPPAWFASWDPSKDFRMKDLTDTDFELLRKADDVRTRITRRLHEAGAKILLGTDNPNPFVVPGFSIHEELRNLVDAGLSPYEAIKAGTRDAAWFLEALSEFGTVEVGKRADLILLQANPMENVGNVAKRVGVMVQGEWYTEEELQEMLEKLVGTYELDKSRLATAFDLALDEGEMVRRYAVKNTDTVLGEERLFIKESVTGYLLTAQQVFNAPPDLDNFKMQIGLDREWIPLSLEFQSSTSEGNSTVRVRRTKDKAVIAGTWPDGENILLEKKCPRDYLLGSSLFGSYHLIGKRSERIGVGDKMELKMLRLETDPEMSFVEATFSVERKPDVEKSMLAGKSGARVYSVHETTSNASFDVTILVDEQSRIVSLERVEQMGLTRFELIEQQETRAQEAEIII
jgi:imidazolonepropionase-like amidohydrolase